MRAMDCIIASKLDSSGYGRIYIKDNRGRRMDLAHRVAWERANGPIPGGLFVRHSCDNRGCVNTEHMFLGTHKDNMYDMKAKGRSLRGSRHNLAKLNESQVLEIRKLQRDGVMGKEIAKAYGVSNALISMIKTRKLWAHL